MTSARPIYLHVDMDAFFASVEQHDHPDLRGRPVVVGSPPDRRGVVSAASYEARKFGIHSAMPSRTARKKCPHAVFMPVKMSRYRQVSQTIMSILESYTPLVQPLSIDEAFLDVTGAQRLFGDGKSIAEKIRHDIHATTGLTASVGVAPNMFLAKIASDLNKPDGLTCVPFDQHAIELFLAPLPIGRLWGAGNVTQKKLRSLGIATFGDLQACDTASLERILGRHMAAQFLRLSRGIDQRGISTGKAEKSISNEITFDADITDHDEIEATFKRLIDKVGKRLRAVDLYASTLHIKVRWSDFSTITRQLRLARPCCDDITLRENAMQLLGEHLSHRPVRLIGFGVSGLCRAEEDTACQLNLFEEDDTTGQDKRTRLSRAADVIRSLYGDQSLKRGSDLE